jgi:hypothetical protein
MNFRWNHVEGLTDLSFQRSHVLLDKTAKEELYEDFRQTAITSFIMFLNDAGEDFSSLFTSDGDGVSTECLEFAIQKVELMIKTAEHEDLDTTQLFDICAKFPQNQKEFLKNIRKIINRTRKFNLETNFLMEMCKSQVDECAEKISTRWPHLRYDGFKNIWIMKPLGQSSGFGVTVVDCEDAIRQTELASSMKFVVQKYIGESMDPSVSSSN